jgi:hypothetical protein
MHALGIHSRQYGQIILSKSSGKNTLFMNDFFVIAASAYHSDGKNK